MGNVKYIENKRIGDQNIMKNRPRPMDEPPEFTLPPETVRTAEERDACVAALEVFVALTQSGLKLPGREIEKDEQLIEAAMRVLSRIS